MRRSGFFQRPRIIFIVFMFFMVTLACGGLVSGQIATAVSRPTQFAQEKNASPAATKGSQPSTLAPKATLAPTGIKKPAITPTKGQKPLKLVDQPYLSQDGSALMVIFLVENPNEDQAVSSSQYQLIVTDESGTVLKTGSGYLELILPGEKQAVVSSMNLEKTQIADKVEVQLRDGTLGVLELTAPLFRSEKVTFYQDRSSAKVTGIIQNGFNRALSNIKISAILYDQNNVVMGGGYRFLNLLPANSKLGYSIAVNAKSIPARIEIYADVTSLASFQKGEAGNQTVKLVGYGYSQNNDRLSVALITENTSKDRMVQATEFDIVAYDANGTVLDAREGYVNALLPEQKTGTTAQLTIPANATVANVEILIDSGPEKFPIMNSDPFSAEKITFFPGNNSSRVTGMIKSSYDQTLTKVEVDVVCYDKQGKIIGGNNTYVDFIAANGQAAFEMTLDLSQIPARMEVYPTITSLTTFGK